MEDYFDPDIHVEEYRRKCNECRKVWHVLVSREDTIEKNIKKNFDDQALAACGMCGGNSQAHGASTQAKRSGHALNNELHRLRSCPKCQSGNYDEEIIIYEKK